jgi:hypothetical protein
MQSTAIVIAILSTVIVSILCCFKRPKEKLWHLLTALAVPFVLINCLYWSEAFEARARNPTAIYGYEMWAPLAIVFCSVAGAIPSIAAVLFIRFAVPKMRVPFDAK